MPKRSNTAEWLSITITLLVILISIVVGKALDLLDLTTVLVGASISTIIILGVVAIVLRFGSTSNQTEVEKIIGELRELLPSAQYDWLYRIAEVNDLEGKTKGRAIWVISPDLSNDTGSPEIDVIGMVKKNLRKKITYTYIVPDTETINAVIQHLRQTFASYPQQLRVIKLQPDTFKMLTTTHIVIFNPNMEDGQAPQVFLELPIDQRGYGKGFWVKVADDIVLGFVGRFRKIVDDGNL